MRIGVDYYPEQWDSSLWDADAETMAKTGVKLIRIGEYAWQRLEPSEGAYDLEWLKDVITIFARRGIGTVLCIPTSCPPVWLFQKYPEIMPLQSDGRISMSRCINSPVFRQYAKRITEVLVNAFALNSAVVAWQIDNELEAYHCTCQVCREKFRQWLMERYGSVENINRALNKSYTDLSQIILPDNPKEAWREPALCLDWYRFTSESVINFTSDIMKLIRMVKDDALITTNTDFGKNRPDYYKLYDFLDFVSYDNYPPVRLSKNPEEISSHAFNLDLMRGIKGGHFWVMEQLSGPQVEQGVISPSPRAGMIMGYAMQAMVRGADMVFHYRWRTALEGAKMHHHGIFDHSNKPNRRFLEFSELCRCVAKLKDLNDTYIESDVAIVYSPISDAAFRIQPQSEGFSYINQLKKFHKVLTNFGANVDVVSPETDLSKYKLVIAPSLYVNREAATGSIYKYVINGGTVVLTARSGVKDEFNNCIMEPLPTVFRELIGAEIEEYDPIGSEEYAIRDFAGDEYICSKWCDILTPVSARAYAVYSGGDYDGCAAGTMNRYCGGVAYYVGTMCKSDFYRSFISNLMMQTGIPKLENLPKGVEVTTRTNGRDEYICFFNNSEERVCVPLPKPMYSMISGTEIEDMELTPFRMEIVRK